MIESAKDFIQKEKDEDKDLYCYINSEDLMLKLENVKNLLSFSPDVKATTEAPREKRGAVQLTQKELAEVQAYRKVYTQYAFMTSDMAQTRELFDKLICFPLKVKQIRYLLKVTFLHMNINIGAKKRKNELTRLLYSHVLLLSDRMIDQILQDYYDLCSTGDNTQSPYDYVQTKNNIGSDNVDDVGTVDQDNDSEDHTIHNDNVGDNDNVDDNDYDNGVVNDDVVVVNDKDNHDNVVSQDNDDDVSNEDKVTKYGDDNDNVSENSIINDQNENDVATLHDNVSENNISGGDENDNVSENSIINDQNENDNVSENSIVNDQNENDMTNLQDNVSENNISNEQDNDDNDNGAIQIDGKVLGDNTFENYDDFYSQLEHNRLSPEKQKPENLDLQDQSYFEDSLNVFKHPEQSTETTNSDSLYDEIVGTPFFNRITRNSIEECKVNGFTTNPCKTILADKLSDFEQLKDNVQNLNIVNYRIETLYRVFQDILVNLKQATLTKSKASLDKLCHNLNSSHYIPIKDDSPSINVYASQYKGSIMLPVFFCNLQCHALALNEKIIALDNGKFCNNAEILEGYDNLYKCNMLSNEINSCSYATRPSKTCAFRHVAKSEILDVYILNEGSAIYFPKELKLRENRDSMPKKVNNVLLQPASKAYITFEEEGLTFFMTYSDILRNFDSLIDFETSLAYIRKTWPSLNIIAKVALGLTSSLIVLLLMTLTKYILSKILSRNETNVGNEEHGSIEENIPLQILN